MTLDHRQDICRESELSNAMIFRILCAIYILIPLLSGLAHGQTSFFQGKTIMIVVGYQAGDGYDIWSRLLAAHYGQTHSWKSRLDGAEHARRGLYDRGELHF
jgi:hypothetical protein